MKDFLNIGKISKFHGIKGDVKVIPLNKDMEDFDNLKEVMINDVFYKVTQIKYLNDKVILKLEGIESIEDTYKLKNEEVYMKRPEESELPEGVFYVSDIEDMEVYDEENVFLGEVSEIIETGSNDVYWIKKPKEILIPATDEVIVSINIEDNKMIIKPVAEWNYEN